MATPIRFGTEFLLNATTTLAQTHPTITALADGRFVATWMDLSTSGDDASGWAVRAQVFNADGSKAGPEFLVNTTVDSAQDYPVVAGLTNGAFVIAWQDLSADVGDTSTYAIRAQIFNADGSAFGSEFLVNTTTRNPQQDPAIAALAGGGFVISWEDYSATGADLSVSAIRGQVYQADGTRTGGEFLVNTTTDDGQMDPAMAGLDGGRFVVVWSDNSSSGGDTSNFAVRAQMFNADGSVFGGEFLVNSATANAQFKPAVTALSDGRFVVAWADYSHAYGDVSDAGITAQVFNADGSRSGAEFRMNATTYGDQSFPAIAGLPDGRFVAVWTEYDYGLDQHGDPDREAVIGQLFNADGTMSGSEFLVNTATDNVQQNAIVHALADGRFVVTWEDGSQSNDPSSWGAAAQIFDPREAAVSLTGTTLSDDLIGTRFGDTIAGGKGADRLAGGDGGDRLIGGVGTDRLIGNNGRDTLRGDGGDDTLFGGRASDKLKGGKGADLLNSGNGDDTLIGEGGDDRLFGNDGNDKLSGNAGADQLAGGLGGDMLIGGGDADIFLYETAADSGTTGATRDLIMGFSQSDGDRIDLSAIDAGAAAGDQAFVFIGTAAFSGAGGELRYVQTGSNTLVEADIDGNGIPDLEILLKGLIALTVDDFVL